MENQIKFEDFIVEKVFKEAFFDALKIERKELVKKNNIENKEQILEMFKYLGETEDVKNFFNELLDINKISKKDLVKIDFNNEYVLGVNNSKYLGFFIQQMGKASHYMSLDYDVKIKDGYLLNDFYLNVMARMLKEIIKSDKYFNLVLAEDKKIKTGYSRENNNDLKDIFSKLELDKLKTLKMHNVNEPFEYVTELLDGKMSSYFSNIIALGRFNYGFVKDGVRFKHEENIIEEVAKLKTEIEFILSEFVKLKQVENLTKRNEKLLGFEALFVSKCVGYKSNLNDDEFREYANEIEKSIKDIDAFFQKHYSDDMKFNIDDYNSCISLTPNKSSIKINRDKRNIVMGCGEHYLLDILNDYSNAIEQEHWKGEKNKILSSVSVKLINNEIVIRFKFHDKLSEEDKLDFVNRFIDVLIMENERVVGTRWYASNIDLVPRPNKYHIERANTHLCLEQLKGLNKEFYLEKKFDKQNEENLNNEGIVKTAKIGKKKV